MKFSKANERDFNFYIMNRNKFTFSGANQKTAVFDINGVDGKTAFFKFENEGERVSTKHPNLLNSLLTTKASVNFHIKMWAEGRADGTLPLAELSKRLFEAKWGNIYIDYKCIEEQYNCPEWVTNAVEQQKVKFW